MAAQLHVGLAIHNFGIQEYMAHTEATNSVFLQNMTFEDGYLHPGDAPGLGVELDERGGGELCRIRPAYLPVSRLQDGTIHDW